MKSNHWQANLEGSLIRLRLLRPDDFDALYTVGSDPEIWKMHSEADRYTVEKFSHYFNSGIESGGAYAILDRKTDQLIGSSRFSNYEHNNSVIVIGYSFLSRDC